ncbi:MAG: oxidoreductase [Rhizobiales bacterium]|nr:oxidoreductase [Hyphomicrobiales bacterium]
MAKKLLLKMRVADIREESDRIKSFTLVHQTRPQLPPFEAGAHVTVLLANGMRRPYSLCSDPADSSRYRLAVLREDHGLGGSRAMHELRSGDKVFVSHPANHFPLAPQAGFHLLIAGGIGITPMLAMVHALKRAGARFRLHYCARQRADMAFAGDLQRLCGPDEIVLHESGMPGGRLDIAAALAQAPVGAHVYCCGPQRLMDAVTAAARNAGFADEMIHIEHFEGVPADQRQRGEPFQIEIRSTGQVLDVPENKSALDVLRENDIVVDAACEGGVCGTCRVKYIAGEPIHRDLALRVEERAHTLLVCVSRATEKLVLEL